MLAVLVCVVVVCGDSGAVEGRERAVEGVEEEATLRAEEADEEEDEEEEDAE